MFISIIIPTFKRPDLLKTVLFALEHQTLIRSKYEIIVVDDGVNKKGAANARNRGIKKAKGTHILFIGDDIIPTKNLLMRHYKMHQKLNNIAVLGHIDWHSELEINDFMKWLAPNGFQFNFRAIKDRCNCGYKYFFTSNISLEKKWFKYDTFNEEFLGCMWEDIELGYRLEKRGLKIVYDKHALAYHCHPQDFNDYIRKIPRLVENGALLAKLHPELKSKIHSHAILKYVFFSILNICPFVKLLPQNLYWIIKTGRYKYKYITKGEF